MGSNRPKPFSALGHISTPMKPPTAEETGKRAKFPSPPPPPKPRGSGTRMAPAMVFVPPRPVDLVTAQIGKKRQTHSAEWESDEKTPVHNPYQIVDGKVVDMSAALPSTPPAAEESSPPTIPETPLAILAKVTLPPAPVLNPVWVEDRGTRIRNGVMFFLLACFIVAGIAGATWAFLWNGRNHQELIEHQRQEQEKQDRYR